MTFFVLPEIHLPSSYRQDSSSLPVWEVCVIYMDWVRSRAGVSQSQSNVQGGPPDLALSFVHQKF